MTQRTWIATTFMTCAGAAGCASDPHYGPVDAGPEAPVGPGDAATNNPVPPPAGVVASGVRFTGRVDTTSEPTHPRFA